MCNRFRHAHFVHNTNTSGIHKAICFISISTNKYTPKTKRVNSCDEYKGVHSNLQTL
jgi:hypothetical protein